MAAEDLPSEFDVVILGTGLAESVAAAAFSRVGQRVLHVDRRSYYAANWASFTFNGLLNWIQQYHEECGPDELQDWSSLLEDGEEVIYLSNPDTASIKNLQVFCFTSEEDEKEEEASSSTPTNAAEDHNINADEEAVKESSETESAGSGEETQEREEEEEPKEAPPAQGEEPEADQSQAELAKKRISYAQLVKEGRRFNIDLVSKLMYSRGSLVDLLIKSNVSRYAEFKNVTRILTYRQGKVEQVPCSRADVFASRQLSVVEKRKLMRFLTSCMEETEEQMAYHGRPYSEFLRDQQLGDNLEHFILHSIAMVTEHTPTEEGLASTRNFLQCLGRYGNTPFLFPVYGLGEIPQCFCRMCAVFGGIYCLRHSVSCLLVDKDTNRCKAVIDSRGQRISCSHFVVEEGYVGPERKRVATPPRFISRAVLITDSSVLSSNSDQQVSLVTIPPIAAGCAAVRMVELSPSTMTCMPGTYLVHLTCQSSGSAYEDLSPLVSRIFCTPDSPDQENCPSVLWCLYFNITDGSGLETEGHDLPSNVYMCSGPDGGLSHENAIKQAEAIFSKILPDEDFCPPAPNPEDIIYDGDATASAEGEDKEGEDKEGEDKEGEKENQDKLEEAVLTEETVQAEE
ncbi:rab proteins geranylgeranyltransferase component A 1 isoform X2 [Takifugu flavidus]|uniref:rab proteins geranylgeranyltransferase component A 1 isoform X2 n=1 Tax=Takifugu flavidus TaxID=433684 RepID=UPI0025441048|nr:rab proteins geranylgeranyltransferase component A 1 isoform X2 [Takifugu flavidus]